ncbi:MAG: hypothetical protein KAT74_00805, partial [Candidatus Cloacimonetes bacterium]|nr:hypothetical protein [Candidatus Cloacimonadota bacterium]
MKKRIFIFSVFIFIFSFSMVWSEISDRYLSSTDEIQNVNNVELPENSRAFTAPIGSIFTQLPHNPSDSWSFATSEVASTYNVAENFWGLGGQTITGIRFWGLSLEYDFGWFACNSEIPMDFEFTFYQDNSGAIGSVVTQFIATPTMTATDSLYVGFICYEFEVTFPSPVSMAEGWISIQGQTASPDDCWFLWASSADGDGDSYQDDGTRAWVSTFYDRGMCLIGSDYMPAGSGHCLDYDGVNEYVNITSGGPSISGNDITCEAWMCLSDTTGNQDLLQKGSNYALFES